MELEVLFYIVLAIIINYVLWFMTQNPMLVVLVDIFLGIGLAILYVIISR